EKYINMDIVGEFSPLKIRGQIQVIFGPMFSGKSTELLRRVRRYQLARHDCLLIKYSHDVRYGGDGICTHDRERASQAAVIGIDEGQFFPDVTAFCEELANAGKTVIVAALDGTFERKAFGSVLSLIPLAESVVKLNAVCMLCYRPAAYTHRLGCETQLEVIGGVDKYQSLCRVCYLDCTINKENQSNLNMKVPSTRALKVHPLIDATCRQLFN
uniref:Thymidine kinase n=1 Tax=Eptatretus burgeri TaxID=7764 RepID=A0A8C4WUT2_EPTBU